MVESLGSPLLVTLESHFMEMVLSNPVDASIEAALELEELKQGIRSDAPALHAFFAMLLKPIPAFLGSGVRMLSDVQNYYLTSKKPKQTKTTSKEDLKQTVEMFLKDLEAGVDRRDTAKIDEAKKLCLAINNVLLARKMEDVYSRRENSDTRFVNHESRAKFKT